MTRASRAGRVVLRNERRLDDALLLRSQTIVQIGRVRRGVRDL